MTKEPVSQETYRDTPKAGREWLEGVHRELERLDGCVERIRGGCVECHQMMASLTTEMRLVSKALEVIQYDLKKHEASYVPAKKIEELDKEISEVHRQFEAAKVKLGVIWGIIAIAVTGALNFLWMYVKD